MSSFLEIDKTRFQQIIEREKMLIVDKKRIELVEIKANELINYAKTINGTAWNYYYLAICATNTAIKYDANPLTVLKRWHEKDYENLTKEEKLKIFQ